MWEFKCCSEGSTWFIQLNQSEDTKTKNWFCFEVNFYDFIATLWQQTAQQRLQQLNSEGSYWPQAADHQVERVLFKRKELLVGKNAVSRDLASPRLFLENHKSEVIPTKTSVIRLETGCQHTNYRRRSAPRLKNIVL